MPAIEASPLKGTEPPITIMPPAVPAAVVAAGAWVAADVAALVAAGAVVPAAALVGAAAAAAAGWAADVAALVAAGALVAAAAAVVGAAAAAVGAAAAPPLVGAAPGRGGGRVAPAAGLKGDNRGRRRRRCALPGGAGGSRGRVLQPLQPRLRAGGGGHPARAGGRSGLQRRAERGAPAPRRRRAGAA